MNCQHCIEFMMDYCDGKLSAEEKRIFDSHLRMCQSCWDYLESYRTTMGLTQSMGDNSLPVMCTEMPDTLVAAIMAARKPKHA